MAANEIQAPNDEDIARSRAERAEIDASARGPVLHLFLSALVWLMFGSALALAASIKLHDPQFLAENAWLTFGRVRPAHMNSMIYGWATMGSSGVALWLMARLCRSPLRNGWSLHLSAALFNVASLVGISGILRGRGTSLEWLEYPIETGPFLAAALLPLAWAFIDMVRRRESGHIYVSQWYLMAAVFWFPWLYLTAQALLLWFPIAAPAMAPVNWWYAHNILGLWFTPVGLAAAYYFIPKVIGQPIHSYYLSLIGFWSLAFFYAWNGMHHLIGGPYPGWLVGMSVAASVMMLVPVITVGVNHHLTMVGYFSRLRTSPTLRFVVFAAMSYTAVSIQGSFTAVPTVNHITHFTHYTIAHAHLGMYAFVTMMLFGSMYYIVPRLTNREWPSARLIRWHFWLTAVGVLVYWGALTVGGVEQGMELANPNIAFLDIVRSTIPWLRIRSFAGVSMTLGQLAFCASMLWLLARRPGVDTGPTLLGSERSSPGSSVFETS